MVDRERYRGLFVQEAREHLATLVQGFEALRQGRDGATLDALFRAAHSFKGMAATLGYDPEAELAHAVEDHLARARSGGAFSQQVLELLVSAVDALADAVDRVEDGGERPDLHHAARRLQAALEVTAKTEAVVPDAKAVRTAAAGLPAERRRVVRLRLAQNCVAPRARLIVVRRVLAQHGAIVAASPDESAWPGVEAGGDVVFVVDSEATPELLQQQVSNIPDIARCELREEPVPAREPGPAPAARAGAATATPRTVRVELDQVDRVLDQAAELRIAYSQLERQLDDLFAGPRPYAVSEALERLYREARGIHETALAMRTLPVGVIVERFPRLVRDLAARFGKDIDLRLEGTDAQADRSVLEVLIDPLTHLVKNAIDHGLESPPQRAAAGKPRRGTLRIAFLRTPTGLRVTVADDGRGIPREAALRTALSRGLIGADEAGRIDDEALFRLLALPGFSTASEVTDVSGRGVGLDAVKAGLEQAGGSMRIASEAGRGTTVTLELPPSLAVLEALEVRVDGEPYYVPVDALLATVPVRAEDRARGTVDFVDARKRLDPSENAEDEVVAVPPEPVRLIDLAAVLALPVRRYAARASTSLAEANRRQAGDRGVPDARTRRRTASALAEPPRQSGLGLVVERHGENACLLVDEVGVIREIVVKTLDLRAARTRYVSGATIQGDGQVGLILDVPSVLLAPPPRDGPARR